MGHRSWIGTADPSVDAPHKEYPRSDRKDLSIPASTCLVRAGTNPDGNHCLRGRQHSQRGQRGRCSDAVDAQRNGQRSGQSGGQEDGRDRGPWDGPQKDPRNDHGAAAIR